MRSQIRTRIHTLSRPQIGTALVLALAASALLPVTGMAQAASAGIVGDRHGPPHSRSNAVVDWNATATQAAVTAGLSPDLDPLAESRLYAITAVAVHDALNAVDRRYRPYLPGDRHVRRGASPEAAVAAAARDVLVPGLDALRPELSDQQAVTNAIASVQAAYTTALAAIPDGPAERLGVEVGQDAAAAIQDVRKTDHSSEVIVFDSNYPQGTEPGQWRFTPDRPFAFAPKWGSVTPFVLRNNQQFAPSGPYPLTSPKYAADLNEIKRLGGDARTGSQRTPEQTQIARFWVGSSPYQWNNIARNLATDHHLDLWDSARLFGLLGMAMADGYTSSFATKFTVKFWRPVTAIRLADSDGNPATSSDPTWNPLVTTPPIPDYDSAHAVEGSAAAAVFTRFFGNDKVRFSVCSLTLPDTQNRCGGSAPVVRHFSGFAQAAAENGESRILVGFHFRKAVSDGLGRGTKIGNRAASLFLGPAR